MPGRRDDGDFLFRLTGEEVRQRFGARIAGLRLSDMPLDSDKQDIRRCYQTAIQHRAPACARGYYDFGRGPETRWEACFLPFSDTHGRVSHLLVGMAYAKAALFRHRRYINMLKISENFGKSARQ